VFCPVLPILSAFTWFIYCNLFVLVPGNPKPRLLSFAKSAYHLKRPIYNAGRANLRQPDSNYPPVWINFFFGFIAVSQFEMSGFGTVELSWLLVDSASFNYFASKLTASQTRKRITGIKLNSFVIIVWLVILHSNNLSLSFCLFHFMRCWLFY
jgi:hypothetical protein